MHKITITEKSTPMQYLIEHSTNKESSVLSYRYRYFYDDYSEEYLQRLENEFTPKSHTSQGVAAISLFYLDRKHLRKNFNSDTDRIIRQYCITVYDNHPYVKTIFEKDLSTPYLLLSALLNEVEKVQMLLKLIRHYETDSDHACSNIDIATLNAIYAYSNKNGNISENRNFRDLVLKSCRALLDDPAHANYPHLKGLEKLYLLFKE